jgi:hypothetical protein
MNRLPQIALLLTQHPLISQLFSNDFLRFVDWIAASIGDASWTLAKSLEMLLKCFDLLRKDGLGLLMVIFHVFRHPFGQLRQQSGLQEWALSDFVTTSLPQYDVLELLSGLQSPFGDDANANYPLQILRQNAHNESEIIVVGRFINANPLYLPDELNEN